MEPVTVAAAVVILLLVGYVLYTYGLFAPVNVTVGAPPLGEATIAYKFSTGPYKNAGPQFREVCKLAENCMPIGIYYDDPKQVPAEKLRWVVGCVLNDNTPTLKGPEHQGLRNAGYKVKKLPKVKTAVMTTFPFKGMLSVLLAVNRCYPKMAAFIEEKELNAHPFLEIYKYECGLMHIMAPLSDHNAFYVEEAMAASEKEHGQ